MPSPNRILVVGTGKREEGRLVVVKRKRKLSSSSRRQSGITLTLSLGLPTKRQNVKALPPRPPSLVHDTNTTTTNTPTVPVPANHPHNSCYIHARTLPCRGTPARSTANASAQARMIGWCPPNEASPWPLASSIGCVYWDGRPSDQRGSHGTPRP